MKNFLLISSACLLALLATVGASLPYPILPPLFASGAHDSLTHFLGLPPKMLFGVALLINPLGLLIGSAVLGPISDRYGRRPVVLASAVAGALGHVLTAGALAIHSYPLFLAARFGTGLLEGQGSVVRAMLAERLQGDLRNRALSWLNGSLHLGWLVGPALAGVTARWGVTVPFYTAAGALLLGAALAAIALDRHATQRAALHAEGSWWSVARERYAFNLLRHRELRELFVVQLAYASGVTAFYEFYPLWLVDVGGYDTRGIALVNVGMCAVLTLCAAFSGGPSRFAPLRRASFLAMGTATAVAAVGAGGIGVGLAGIMLFGLPHASYNAVVQGWAAERFGGHGQGAVMGLLSTTFCLANILMALAGAVLTLVDTRLVLLLGAALTAFASVRMGRLRAQAVPAAAQARE